METGSSDQIWKAKMLSVCVCCCRCSRLKGKIDLHFAYDDDDHVSLLYNLLLDYTSKIYFNVSVTCCWYFNES